MEAVAEAAAIESKEEEDAFVVPEFKKEVGYHKRTPSQLDLTGAFINDNNEDDEDTGTEKIGSSCSGVAAPSIDLPLQTAKDVSHFALDIGGSLIKLVYFSPDPKVNSNGRPTGDFMGDVDAGGRLVFKKWETTQLDECIRYITKHRLYMDGDGRTIRVKATGGGAFKFEQEFLERLGLQLDRQDEMKCLVAGCDFFLKVIPDEVFTFHQNEKNFVSFNDEPSIYPYLLVNIGSGVSMIKVVGEGIYERISGTNIGGGTFWGLCRLLTGLKNFDEMLKLSASGDNTAVDMLVGDIYGGHDYSKVGLAASTIASSFGKVVMNDSCLVSDYKPEDIALSLLRMISYNIAQVAVLNALKHGLRRLIFGGFFIRGHPYTMSTISYAIHYWSKGEYRALFMRHEGFLGSLGCFLQGESELARRLSCSNGIKKGAWVESFIRIVKKSGNPMSSFPPLDPEESMSSVDKASSSTGSMEAVQSEGGQNVTESAKAAPSSSLPRSSSTLLSHPLAATELPAPLGELRLVPHLMPFPLLANTVQYQADTFNLQEAEEHKYWINIFKNAQASLVKRAVQSRRSALLAAASSTTSAELSESEAESESRGRMFDSMFSLHLHNLQQDKAMFGRCSLASIFEFREECLRQYGFQDVYLSEKESENMAALEALPSLLLELDNMEPDDRILALMEGVLAGNIFDWGSRACVELYSSGVILDIYRKARKDLRRPWVVDHFEAIKSKLNEMYGGAGWKKVLIFMDNSGADAVLGVVPLARELLRKGAEVVLCCNKLPALNDITALEMRGVVVKLATICPVIHAAVQAARLSVVDTGSGSPCINLRVVSEDVAQAAVGADLVILEGMGRAVHTNLYATFKCDCIKVAMIKNKHVAESLFNGNLYDCVCKFEPALNS